MNSRLLLCTDLDRTLIPNGAQPESPGARQLFRKLVSRPEVMLAYVTGRHRVLVEEAIEYYQLPVPDYAIADVGSTVYQIKENTWTHWSQWEAEIAEGWAGKNHQDLKKLLSDLTPLRLQEQSKQNRFKLSYYVPLHTDRDALESEIRRRFLALNIEASLIWSIDEPSAIGLLDVLPVNATKRHAIEFLIEQNGFTMENTLFAGDSGNDLPVLVSPIHAILVANASDEVRAEAVNQVDQNDLSETLYLANGSYAGMNGNYSAGIIEGVIHYMPALKQWVEE